MGDLLELYRYAEQQNIDVDWFSMQAAESLSVCSEGNCAIAIDPWKLKSLADERCKLAHELGHCETGGFYNPYTRYNVIARYENRADRWAIKKLIPEDELNDAVSKGYTEVWELAEYFDVTEDFVRKAVAYYQQPAFART